MRHRTQKLGGALLLVSCLVQNAEAADAAALSDEAATGPTGAASSQADALLDEGVLLRRAGREREALDVFKRAYALHPSARALGQMGLAAKSLRLYLEAAADLELALASDEAWVTQNREALELARLIVTKQLANVLVRSNVERAELWVNGERMGALPMGTPARVLAGATQIEVRAAGYVTSKSNPTLAAEKLTELEIPLTRAHSSAPLGTPLRESTAPAADPKAQPEPESAPLRPWIYTSLATGGVALGVGTYLGVTAIRKKDERDAICPAARCPTQEGVDLDGEARAHANASTALLVIGSAGVTAAAVLWIVELTGPPPPAMIVLAPTGSGLWAGGSFSF